MTRTIIILAGALRRVTGFNLSYVFDPLDAWRTGEPFTLPRG